jgi:hypothetical protein
MLLISRSAASPAYLVRRTLAAGDEATPGCVRLRATAAPRRWAAVTVRATIARPFFRKREEASGGRE